MLQHSTYCSAGYSGTPTADSRFAVPCPSDRNALRNPPRQHVPTVTNNFNMEHDKIELLEKKIHKAEVDILRQERGFIKIGQNFINHVFSSDKEKSLAVLHSLIVKLFWNRVAISALGGIGGLLTIYFLYQQNNIIIKQNELIEIQNTAIIRQFNSTVTAQYESLLLNRDITVNKNKILTRFIESLRIQSGNDTVRLSGYSDITFDKNNLEKVIFEKMNFRQWVGTTINGSIFKECSLNGSCVTTNITNSNIISLNISGADIMGLKIDSTNIQDLKLLTFTDAKNKHSNSINKLSIVDSQIHSLSLSTNKISASISNSKIKYLKFLSKSPFNLDSIHGVIHFKDNVPLDERAYVINLSKNLKINKNNCDNITFIENINDLKEIFQSIEDENKSKTLQFELTSVIEWNDEIKNLFENYKYDLGIENYY